MEKRKIKKISFVFWVIALCLIMVGVFAGKKMEPVYTFSADDNIYYDVSGFVQKFEIEIDKNNKYGSLDVDSAEATIILFSNSSKKVDLEYNILESDEDEYVFEAELRGSDAMRGNKVSKVYVKTLSGREVVFENEFQTNSMFDKFGTIALKMFSFFFALVFVVFGIVVNLAKKSENLEENSTTDENQTTISDSENNNVTKKHSHKTVTCDYCGIENDQENAKCDYCGAPIYKDKKKNR